MARFIIVLLIVLGCLYFVFTKTDWTTNEPSKIKPIPKEKIFDFEGARQRGIERQRRIDNGEF